ncbi:MAG: FMN-binding protein [Bacteroidales bacterium]|nr:FMN-binding protein [Bacteroidales bacterium]
MKKLITAALVATLITGAAMAQQPKQHCGNCPHHQHAQQCQQQSKVNADGIDMAIIKAFPAAKSVKKSGKWTEVYDSMKNLLGYVVYSKPASDDIKGYNGETPVMIAFNTKKVITGVYLLPNQETPKFVQHVEQTGYFNSWNGLTVKKALKKKVDTVSGATFTSKAVAESVQAILKTL